MTPTACDWHRLVLHPRAPAATLAASGLRATVVDLGLVGAAFHHAGRTYYAPGPRFLELVVFLGCSPVIELEPIAGAGGGPAMDRFCHIHVPAPAATPRLWLGAAQPRPRCPGCGAALPSDGTVLARWQAAPLEPVAHCPACGARHAPARLRWRRGAAVAANFIEIGGIFPQEAIPADGLLADLAAVGLGPWDYFYVETRTPRGP